MKSIQGCAIDVGDLVYDEETETFQRVIATHAEQGSGSRPSRAWVAYEGNPVIAEIDIFAHYVVKREAPASKDATQAEPSSAQTESDATFEVVCQAWEESERGWGVRPDGYTLHLSIQDRNAWVDAHYARHTGSVPDEYTRKSGDPFMLTINAELHEQLLARKRDGYDGLHQHQIDRTKCRPL